MIDRKAFFDEVRESLFGGSLRQEQVNGINYILNEWERRSLPDTRWLAYMLATVYHETATTMQPIVERGSRSYFRKYEGRKDLGNVQEGDGYLYRGRGFVQLTGRDNYKRMTRYVGADLLSDPERALEPGIATVILFEGMIRGVFTGKRLEDYFKPGAPAKWFDARRIVNGTDRATEIASYARKFHAAIGVAQTDKRPPAASPVPPRPFDNPEDATRGDASPDKPPITGKDVGVLSGVFGALAAGIASGIKWLFIAAAVAGIGWALFKLISDRRK